MVNAKLHIICGNCGGTTFDFRINPEGNEVYDREADEEYTEPSVWISCKNCTTLHDLGDTVPPRRPDKEDV